MTKALERATAADISGIVALLAQHHLPVDGVHDRLATTLVEIGRASCRERV